jgi:hypothetical protein
MGWGSQRLNQILSPGKMVTVFLPVGLCPALPAGEIGVRIALGRATPAS